jgi:hypothetical protein
MDSILDSVKKMLGIGEDYEHFDTDIIIHINSVLMILTQIGVGPEEGFLISGADSKWNDFVTNDILVEAVKSYVYLRVKILFDPPSSSFVLDSMNNQARELEWRINLLTGERDE